MSGTLQVNEQVAWQPAGWIFNNVLERAAAELAPNDAKLAETVGDALGPVPGHLDLLSLSPARFQLFVRAMESVHERVSAGGESAFHGPAFYNDFMAELQALLDMLHADPRL